MKNFLLLLATAALLVSCNPFTAFNSDKLQYMPFQEEKDGQWGMISTDGEVLFTDEFKEEPTVVTNDRFFAKNNDGKWELFTAEKKPQQVGKNDYEQAGAFKDDVTPVSMKGKPIQFIDKDGNVVFELDKVGGKKVDACSNFSEGVAIFSVGDYVGCINDKGDVVVQPQYIAILPASDGKMLAVDKKYKDKDEKDIKLTVLSTNGDKISDIPLSKYSNVGAYFEDNMIWVKEATSDGKDKCGIIDANGNVVVKPSPKIQAITAVNKDEFIFNNDDEYGLMNTKGEVILRAKYKQLAFAKAGDLLFAANDDDKIKLINEDGDEVSKDSYENVKQFHGSAAAVKESEDNWIFINKKGEDLKVKSDIYDISDDNYGDEIIYRNGENESAADSAAVDSAFADVDSADVDYDYAPADSAAADDSYYSSSDSYTMTGTIDKYPITMYVEFDGGNASGWYYYNKYQRKITFSGTLDDDNNLDIYCEGGDHFAGTFAGGAYSGTFYGNNGNNFYFTVSQ